MLSVLNFINILKTSGYQYKLHEHDPLFTVEDSKKNRGEMNGSHSKNLFFKNKKNKFYLISCEENTNINIKKISKELNLGNISFAKEEYLLSYLGIKPGSVSPYALLNDTQNVVDFFLEKKLYESEFVNFHPLSNKATITMLTKNFINFMIENNKKIHIFSTENGSIIKTYE